MQNSFHQLPSWKIIICLKLNPLIYGGHQHHSLWVWRCRVAEAFYTISNICVNHIKGRKLEVNWCSNVFMLSCYGFSQDWQDVDAKYPGHGQNSETRRKYFQNHPGGHFRSNLINLSIFQDIAAQQWWKPIHYFFLSFPFLVFLAKPSQSNLGLSFM